MINIIWIFPFSHLYHESFCWFINKYQTQKLIKTNYKINTIYYFKMLSIWTKSIGLRSLNVLSHNNKYLFALYGTQNEQ